MKIAIYKDTFANNRGADIAVKNLAAGLSERGHFVTLFDKSEFFTKIRGDYDVIISTGTNEILDLAKVDGLAPIIQQFHTDPTYSFRHWIKHFRRNRAIKLALRKVAKFQVLCDSHVAKLQRIIKDLPPEKISVIGNWSSFEGRNVLEAECENVIICPGAINKDKNQNLLVDAFAKIAAEFPDWKVHIYGKGKIKDEKALVKRIKTRNLEDRIFLKGYADLSNPYSKCAFVAFPSKTEGFGMVTLDAAMFAKPTLMIQNWIGCGEVVAPRNFEMGLRKLISDHKYRYVLGEECKAYCKKNYSKSIILDKWESILRV